MRIVIALSLLLLLAAPVFAQPIPNGIHIQLSSAIDQTPTAAGVPVVMEQIDSIFFFGHNGSDTITALAPGNYMIIAAPQVRDQVTSKKKKKNHKSCLDFWLRHNGTDVTNSNVQICFPSGKEYTDVIVAQAIVPLMTFDTLQVIASAPFAQGAFLDAITVPGEPLIPSIIFSAFRIR